MNSENTTHILLFQLLYNQLLLLSNNSNRFVGVSVVEMHIFTE